MSLKKKKKIRRVLRWETLVTVLWFEVFLGLNFISFRFNYATTIKGERRGEERRRDDNMFAQQVLLNQ